MCCYKKNLVNVASCNSAMNNIKYNIGIIKYNKNSSLSLQCYIFIAFYYIYILYYSLQNCICGNIYQDFIVTHYCIVFCHLTIHDFS